MADQKLDIFAVLKAISTKDHSYFNTLSDDECKSFIPFVVTRWLSGTSNPQQIMLLNEFVNPVAFELGNKHKRLLFNLMAVCSPGKPRKYTWSKLPGKSSSSRPVSTKLISDYYQYSTNDAGAALQVLSIEQVLAIAHDLGYQSDQITKIKKEMKPS